MQRLVKYNNRKIYSKNLSAYITLEDIRDYIVKGMDFQVTDKKTGEDLTEQVICSTVAELVVNAQKVSPSFLKSMIIDTFKLTQLK